MSNTYCEAGYCPQEVSEASDNNERLSFGEKTLFVTGAYSVLALILFASLL